ncbi:MAG: hypothetical protein HQM11_12015 [SAR324 cluster bacterium]|nr:hypothetical protein [SAR324 cluster bacterium]
MTTAIIVCGETSLDTIKKMQHVAVLSPFRIRGLLNSGIHCISLFDIELSDSDNHSLCKKLDENLQQEHQNNPVLKWAPLAFCDVYFRFIYYYQFKQRLTLWLNERPVKKLVLSSGKEGELLLAARSVCEQHAIELEILQGPLDDFSCTRSSHFYLPHDLPLPDELAPSWSVNGLLSFLKKKSQQKVLVQSYWNLPTETLPAIPFKWIYAIGIKRGIKNLLSRLLRKTVQENQALPWENFVYTSPEDTQWLDESKWDSFDPYDRFVINSVLNHFYQKYPVSHLDQLVNRVTHFLKVFETKKIILMHDYVPSSRLLCFAGHMVGATIQNLPHGVIWEGCSPEMNNEFSPDTMLVWNESSKKMCSRYVSNAVVVTHPRNQIPLVPLKKFNLGGTKINVLVLMGSRVIPSLTQRMDCFESDFLEIWKGLKQLDIQNISVKYHNAAPIITARTQNSVKLLEETCGEKFTTIPASIDVRKIIQNYDLVIVCACTTAILEVMQRGIPLLVFRGYLENCGVLNSFQLPEANTAEELVSLLENYPHELYDAQFKSCLDSLTQGVDWFSL